MAAGFKGDVQGRGACLVAGLIERTTLGMRTAEAPVTAAPHDPPIPNDSRPDKRIGCTVANAEFGQLKSDPHLAGIVHWAASWSARIAAGRSSAPKTADPAMTISAPASIT